MGLASQRLWFQGARGCASAGGRRRIFLGGACALAVAPAGYAVMAAAALIVDLSTQVKRSPVACASTA